MRYSSGQSLRGWKIYSARYRRLAHWRSTMQNDTAQRRRRSPNPAPACTLVCQDQAGLLSCYAMNTPQVPGAPEGSYYGLPGAAVIEPVSPQEWK